MKKIIWFVCFLILFLLILFKDSLFGLYSKITLEEFVIIENTYDSVLRDDYENLLKIVDITNNLNYEYLYSKVIFNDVYGLKNEVTILKGSNNSLARNMVVINDLGLVGIISDIDEESSRVKLINSGDLNVSVQINESFGVLKYEKRKFIVDGLTVLDNININDPVYTSGLGFFAKNIFVGYVSEIKINELKKEVVVSSLVDFNNLNFVVVIKDKL